MKTRQLYYFLSRLNKEERKGFRDFLESPLYNTSDLEVRYLDLFNRLVLGREDNPASAEEFFEHLYPGKPFNANYLRKLTAGVQEKLMHYIAVSDREPELESWYLKLPEEFNRRGWEKHFPKIQKKATEIMSANRRGNAETLQAALNLEMEGLIFQIRQQTDLSQVSFGALNDRLDIYYFFQKIKFASSALNKSRMEGMEAPENPLLSEVLDQVARVLPNLPVTLQIYYQIYMGMRHPDLEEHYRNLKELLFQHAPEFPPDEAYEFYISAINYCTRKIREGRKEYMKEIIELVHHLLENKILLDDKGRISEMMYKNMNALLCQMGDFPGAQKFIPEYARHLKDDPDNLYPRYNEAVLFYFQGQFQKCIDLLEEILPQIKKVIWVYYALDAQRYLAMACYDVGNWESLERCLRNFRNFLKHDELVGEHQHGFYFGLVKYLNRLMGIVTGSPDGRRKKLNELEAELMGKENVYYTGWFLERLRK